MRATVDRIAELNGLTSAGDVQAGQRLEAALAWIPSGRGESLYLAACERSDPDALTAVLLHARRALFHQSYLSLEFPSGEFDGAIQSAGFKSLRTLIWMQATT